MADFEFTDNSAAVLKALEAAKARALEICGEKAESYAKALCPVDTGNLRNSITHFQQGGDEYIGTAVKYAPFVELGTIRMKARPYLRPAAQDHGDEYKSIIESELKNG